MTIYVHCSPNNVDNISVQIVPSIYAPSEVAYLTSENLSLEDYAQEYKRKLAALERRYAYLERGRNWAINNFRRLVNG